MNNRVVIVTGASRGLGKALALRFGSAGDRVVVNCRATVDEAEDVARSIAAAGGDASVVQADVRDRFAVNTMVGKAITRWDRVDVLINNAGMTRDGLAIIMKERDWDAVLETNLTGPFNCIRAVAEIMIRQRNGHIVNIGSIAGVHGREGQLNYAVSKAGLIGLSKSAARELGNFNIKVNAVLPGYLATDMGGSVSAEVRERISRECALGRSTTPAEVAEFVYRLSMMDNVSGQVFNLDSRIL